MLLIIDIIFSSFDENCELRAGLYTSRKHDV